MTLIEIKAHRWGWKALEAPGVEPVFPTKDDAISYAQTRARFRTLLLTCQVPPRPMGIWPKDIGPAVASGGRPLGPARQGLGLRTCQFWPWPLPRPFFISKNFSFVEIFKNAWR
jgi:hypothetical protein